MQVKKDEMKNKILAGAKREFLEKGFVSASVRSIVKGAGTTIGNFYNYFDGKEAVFSALVNDSYLKIASFMSTHKAEDENPFVFSELGGSEARDMVAKALENFDGDFIENIILLIDASSGTVYENTKDEITSFVHHHFIEHRDIINPRYKDNGMGELMSRQFVDGVVSVLKKNIDVAAKVDLISQYLLFFAIGMLGVLKK